MENKIKFYSLLPIKPYIINGSMEFVNELSNDHLQKVINVKNKYFDFAKAGLNISKDNLGSNLSNIMKTDIISFIFQVE